MASMSKATSATVSSSYHPIYESAESRSQIAGMFPTSTVFAANNVCNLTAVLSSLLQWTGIHFPWFPQAKVPQASEFIVQYLTQRDGRMNIIAAAAAARNAAAANATAGAVPIATTIRVIHNHSGSLIYQPRAIYRGDKMGMWICKHSRRLVFRRLRLIRLFSMILDRNCGPMPQDRGQR